MTHIGELDHPQNTPANTRRTAKATEFDARLQLAKQREEAFVATARDTAVGNNGGTLNLNLKNPDGTGRVVDVVSIQINTQFEGCYTVYDSFSSAPSGGSANGIDNLLMDGSNEKDTGSMSAAQNVTFAADGAHSKHVVPSGGAGGQMGGAGTGTEPIIEETRQIVVEVTNNSGSDAAASINIVYIEQ